MAMQARVAEMPPCTDPDPAGNAGGFVPRRLLVIPSGEARLICHFGDETSAFHLPR